MRDENCLVLMCRSIKDIYCVPYHLRFSLIPCLILLLLSLIGTWFLLFTFSFFDEGQKLLIFTVERFFSVHCRQKSVLLLCFTSLFFSVCCCRRPLVLLHKYFCLFVGYCRRRHCVLLFKYF